MSELPENPEIELDTEIEGAPLASAPESTPEPVEDEQQELINAKAQELAQKAINKQTRKMHDERRAREKAERELSQLKAQQAELEQSRPAPTIPPIPNPYDEDYEAKMQARDAAILAKARHDDAVQQNKQRQQKLEEEKQQAEFQKAQDVVDSYVKKAQQMGISQDDMEAASMLVGNSGIQDDLANFLLQQEDSPLLMQYLAANPVDLEELVGSTPYEAAVRLSTDIRQKAHALKPKPTATPEPPDRLEGGRIPQSNNFVRGAIYE